MKTKSKSIVRAQSRLMRRIRIAKILAMFGLMLISVRAAEEASSTDSAGKEFAGRNAVMSERLFHARTKPSTVPAPAMASDSV